CLSRLLIRNTPKDPLRIFIVERCMCTMQTGTQMTKLKGKKKGLVRFFYLDEHKSCIRWRPSRKHDKAKITIDSIHEVCEGKKSEIFQRYIIDPFVEVEIIGLPVDCAKEQTRVVDDNGFNPMWEETLVFNVHMPQIALVRFQVWDHDPIGRDFIGQRTIAFTSMMPGYRHVYLEGMAEASIFIHVAVNDITGKVILGPAAKAAFHKGIMSEPVRRAHRVKINESPETRKGILRRMSSTVSNSGVVVPCVKGESSDLETSSQASCPDSPVFESQTPFEAELESQPKAQQPKWVDHQNPVQTFEPKWPEPAEELATEPKQDNEIVPEPQLESGAQTDSVPQPETMMQPLPNCPRKQTTSPQTPMMNRKPASNWQPQPAQNYGSYSNQVKPIPNGLCLSDSASSSNGSISSLDFVPPCVPTGGEQREGTLQREMNALFDQKIKEIRCKSPLFMNGKLWLFCNS
uniref:C2 domain-containing protein n=1 Tax=Myripristis murdjan TaxID=586833 RepID=A0A667WK60_9TELE